MQRKEAIIDKLIGLKFCPENHRDRLMKSRKATLLNLLEKELANQKKTVDDVYLDDLKDKLDNCEKINYSDLGYTQKDKKAVNQRVSKLRKLQAKKVSDEQVKQVLDLINQIY